MKTKVTKDNIRLLSHKDKVRFALFCAKQNEQIKPEAINCIRVVEKWLDGKATTEECEQAYAANATNATYAAYVATNYAAYIATYAAYAAYAATYATNAAAYAANYAANATTTKQDIVRQQEVYLYELLHIDDIVEKELLSEE